MEDLVKFQKEIMRDLICKERPWEDDCRIRIINSVFDDEPNFEDFSISAKPQSPKDKPEDDSDEQEFSYTMQTMSHLEAKAALAYLKKQGLTISEIKQALGKANFAHATSRPLTYPSYYKKAQPVRLGSQYENIRYSRYADRPYQRYIMNRGRARIGISDADTDYVEASQFRETERELERLRQQRARTNQVTSRTARTLVSSEDPAVTSTTDPPPPVDADEAAEFQEAVDETFPQGDEAPIEGVEDTAAAEAEATAQAQAEAEAEAEAARAEAATQAASAEEAAAAEAAAAEAAAAEAAAEAAAAEAATQAATARVTAARTALQDAFSKFQSDMVDATAVNTDGATALRNLRNAQDSAGRSAAARTVRNIASELESLTETATASQDAYFAATRSYTDAIQSFNSSNSTQVAATQQELIDLNTARTMRTSLTDMNYSVENIDGLVDYYSGLSTSAEATRVAAAEMLYSEAFNALGKDVVVPESVKLNVMRNGGDMTQALRSWLEVEESFIDAPVTAAQTTTDASYKLFQDQMSKVYATQSEGSDLMTKLEDTSLSDGQLTDLHSQIRTVASRLTTELTSARSLNAAYLTAVASQDTVMLEQTTLRQSLLPSSEAYTATTVQDTNLFLSSQYSDSIVSIEESISGLDETIGMLDSIRSSAIADELIATTNAAAQTSLDGMRSAIDTAEGELATLESEMNAASDSLEAAIQKVNVSDVVLAESVEADLAAAQTASQAYDTAVLKYQTKLTSLTDSVRSYNASNSFSILEQNGENPASLLEPTGDVLEAAKLVQTTQNTNITSKIDTWSTNTLDEAASFRSTQLSTLRTAYTTANDAYLTARANLQGTVDAINSDSFFQLEDSAKLDLFRIQKQQLTEQATKLAARDAARSGWLTEANTVSDHMTSVQQSVDLSRSSMSRTALENPELTLAQSRITTEIQTTARLQSVQGTSVTSQMSRGFRDFTLSAANLAGSNIGSTARSMSAGVRALLTMKNAADSAGSAVLNTVARGSLNALYKARLAASRGAVLALNAVEAVPGGQILTAPVRMLSFATRMLVGGLARAAGPLGAVAATGLAAWSITETLINAFKSMPDSYSYSFSTNTQDNMIAPLPDGVPHNSSMRDRGHDSYDGQDSTSFQQYFQFYTSDGHNDAITNALQNGLSADQLYNSGDMTTFHTEHSWSFLEVVAMFPAWGLVSALPTVLNHELGGQAAPNNFKASFGLFYGALQSRYNESINNGDSPETAAQVATMYGNTIMNNVDNGRSVNIGIDDGVYSVQTGYNESDTADFLAAYEQDPYVFWGMDEQTLERMGLNGDMASDAHFMTTHNDTWNQMTTNNPFFAAAQVSMENTYNQTVANATVDSFANLISNVPSEDPAYGYLLQQLNAIKQDPSIVNNLSADNKQLVELPSNIDATLAITSPYFFSVNAAWQAQTTIYRNISSFQEELPNWFAFNTIAPVEGLTSQENQQLSQSATLMQELGVYDYNLTNSEGYHPESGQLFRSTRFETDQYDGLLSQLNSIREEGLSIGNTAIDDVLFSYMRQYDREGAANSRDAAVATVIGKVELAQSEGRGISFLSVSNPDTTLVRGSMVQDLNTTQSSHYEALYNQDNTRWVGYDANVLQHLGLNTNLANGALAEGESVVNENSDVSDDNTVQQFSNALDDQQATLSVISPEENVDSS